MLRMKFNVFMTCIAIIFWHTAPHDGGCGMVVGVAAVLDVGPGLLIRLRGAGYPAG
jgi:hypothetical protein